MSGDLTAQEAERIGRALALSLRLPEDTFFRLGPPVLASEIHALAPALLCLNPDEPSAPAIARAIHHVAAVLRPWLGAPSPQPDV